MQLLKNVFVLLFTAILSVIFLFQVSNSKEKIEKKCTLYKWVAPDTNDAESKLLFKNCSSCHMAYYEEWKEDKHSSSHLNEFFLSIYGGTDKNGKENIYPGFRLDHPELNGNCALCHNPEAALSNTDVDLRSLNSKRTNGISCNLCHKIESVDQDPLKKGVAGLSIDSCEGLKDIRFGSIKDPIQFSKNEELKYNSLYKTSLHCAKCHDGSNGNVQIYSTFTEWINSPAAKKGVQCQSCHMLPRESKKEIEGFIVDNPDIKRKKRPYYEIHSHSFLTNNPHEFRKKYVDLKIDVEMLRRSISTSNNKIIVVKATVKNNNFGHSFPTGSPMRNAILVLDVKCKNGKGEETLPLPHQTKGPQLPNYAGDLKGKAGKLFAKILSETSSEYGILHGASGLSFRKIANKLGIPAQDWWNVYITSDTRIKANEEDVSVYEFEIPQNSTAEITATLLWRNTWPELLKLKGFKLKEDLLIKKKISI